MLYRLLYPRADRVICQSRAMAEDLRSVSGIGPQKPAVLPNPIEIERIRALAARKSSEAEEIRAPRLLAAGRLAPEKGFDLLLEALPAVRAQWPGVHLTLAGEGVEEGRLKRLAEKLGVRSSVCFAGAVQDLAALFSAADLFVLSSRREGLPNALLEAAAGGLPLLATPASGGVVDLLRDQPGCWISPGMTSAALAATLLSALSALSPGERFPHPFIESFGLQPALAEWNALLTATLEEQ
jgi:glycosyltransferase involved in cell wall biosynthesis